jgi:hypothetical protein
VRSAQSKSPTVIVEAVDARILDDPDAQLACDASRTPNQLGRVDETAAGVDPQAGEVGRRVDVGTHRVGVEQPRVPAVRPGEVGPRPRASRRDGAFTAMAVSPTRRRSDSIRCLSTVATNSARFFLPMASKVRISVGQRETPRASP